MVFLIPQNKIEQIIAYKHLLTKKQKEQILSAIQNGEIFLIRQNRKPRVARGLQNRKQKGKGLQNRVPPPFIGNWDDYYKIGKGQNKNKKIKIKIKKRTGPNIRRKFTLQKYSSIKHTLVRKPKFRKNVPISNCEILKWVKYLGIDNFIKILSRDKIANLKKNGCFIINLDSSEGNGTHWIAINIKPKIIEYFDSFGLYPPLEFIELVRKKNMRYLYNSSHYKNIYSSTCGYFCLYYVDQSCKTIE